MPTGYTAGVADGSIKTFKEFALLCARAFGATITLRDDKLSSDIPEFEPSQYNLNALHGAQERKAEAEAMTDTECEQAASEAHQTAMHVYEESLERNRVRLERYQAMIAQAEKWKAPTPEHEEHRTFMLQQLRESMRFDDSSDYLKPPKPQTGEEWRAEQIAKAERDIAYHTKANDEEVERTKQRNDWVNSLKQGLEAFD